MSSSLLTSLRDHTSRARKAIFLKIKEAIIADMYASADEGRSFFIIVATYRYKVWDNLMDYQDDIVAEFKSQGLKVEVVTHVIKCTWE